MRSENRFARKALDLVLLCAAGAVAMASSTPGAPLTHGIADASGAGEILIVETFAVNSDCPGAPKEGTLRMTWQSTVKVNDYGFGTQRWSDEPFESNAMDLGFPSRTFVRIGDTILNATRLEDAPKRISCSGLAGSGAAGTDEPGRFLNVGQGALFLCEDERTREARCTIEVTLLSHKVEGNEKPEKVARSRGDGARPGDEP